MIISVIYHTSIFSFKICPSLSNILNPLIVSFTYDVIVVRSISTHDIILDKINRGTINKDI